APLPGAAGPIRPATDPRRSLDPLRPQSGGCAPRGAAGSAFSRSGGRLPAEPGPWAIATPVSADARSGARSAGWAYDPSRACGRRAFSLADGAVSPLHTAAAGAPGHRGVRTTLVANVGAPRRA